MRRLVQTVAVWTAIWIVLLVVAYVLSSGEPVCEGPLILGADDSDPPQCDDPIVGLTTVAPVLHAIGLVPALLTASTLHVRNAQRERRRAVSETHER